MYHHIHCLGLGIEMTFETAVRSQGPAHLILVVGNDLALQLAMKRQFEAGGFVVELQSDAEAALESVCTATPSAVVLDLTLPSESGTDLCRKIRAWAPSLPIVVLSTSSDVSKIVSFLELGADDYLTIPFSPRELLARVLVALRHANHPCRQIGRVLTASLWTFEGRGYARREPRQFDGRRA
jgi:DNA-binding response OmpR family regulator